MDSFIDEPMMCEVTNYAITHKADLQLAIGGSVEHFVGLNRDGSVCICGETMQLKLSELLAIHDVIEDAISNKKKDT